MNPTHRDFWFLPLGGCGEIGMNLNLYGHAGHWLMVDCGVTFEKLEQRPGAGNQVEMADPGFIANRFQALSGIIATHAHEDHIGALPYLWEQFRCPIYTTPFTRNVILQKFRQHGVDAPVITVNPGDSLQLGPFCIDWLPITHSTPETHALLINIGLGSVLHTADWKLDSAPIIGAAIDPALYRALGRRRIDAVVCDSTNATRAGHSVSESELFAGLLEVIRSSPGRVVVGCFASNIARLQTLGNVGYVAKRYLGVLGRSLHRMIGCARAAGYLKENFNPVATGDLGYLLPSETLMMATGSQGEAGAALHRLAMDSHPDLNLAAGDHVILSAKTIPGNEAEVEALVRTFEARRIQVTLAEDSSRLLHASGHPCADELRQMYEWVKPRVAIPVHGEARHLQRNAEIARAAGVPVQLLGENGDLFDLLNNRVQQSAAAVGRLFLDPDSNRLLPVRRER
ncbi:MAG: ribonuclease J [Gammaproteobacteria bacterium]|nr:ribonuclease J [Pseudomonadales bacterium]MCP5347178.1 ribonuclease J [Pseudomonadales bacterium]